MDEDDDHTGSLLGWLFIFLAIFIGGLCLLAMLTRALSS
jgi:hypothetical protein